MFCWRREDPWYWQPTTPLCCPGPRWIFCILFLTENFNLCVSVHHIFREREDQESGKLWRYHWGFFPDITWQVSKSLFYCNDILEYSKYPDWVNNFNDNSWSKRLMWWHFIFNECSFIAIVRFGIENYVQRLRISIFKSRLVAWRSVK